MTKYVKSRIKINKAAIKKLEQAAVTALEQTGDALLGDVIDKQVIPFGDSFERGGKTHKGGTLQNEGTYLNTEKSKQGSVEIVSSTPYARRLYYHPEYNFRKADNPNAKGKWFDDWLPGGKYEEFTPKAFALLYKKLGGV